MDLVTINRSDYTAKQLVELNWRTDTLLWTERFQQLGDFELHTQAVNSVMTLLPERSMCSLLDTNEVMWVDSHEIDKNDDGVDELIVKGRSLEWILMRRYWANAPYGKKSTMAQKYSVRQAVEAWVWNAICNDTGNDRIKTSASYPAGNALPNVIVTDSVPPSTDGPDQSRKVQNGYVYDQMQEFMTSGKIGIRIIRPNGTSGRKVYIHADGEYEATSTTDITDLRFDFYTSRDISDSIAFSWKAGHLDGPSYLLSSEQLMTGAFVDGDPRTHYYTDPDVIAGTNTGWNRLDGYVDGGSKDDGVTADDFEESLEDQGLRTVRKDGGHINSVDAQISPSVNFKYGKDYRLGDKVLVQGQYGAQDKKWVTEFIRSQDVDGEKAFPTLSSTLS